MILQTIVVAIALGITAQVVAERLKLPAILPLLIFGIVAGPNLPQLLGLNVGGLFDPAALGEGLEVFIHLGIAVILFEGGLSLNPHQLRRVGGAVRNLLSIGVAVTWVGSAWVFQWATGMSWSVAALFGAIVTVTGPTVIVPLLRQMVVPRRVATVLVSEGLIIDPIGAVLAYLVLQAIERPGMPFGPLAQELVWLTVIGIVIGFAAGSLAKLVVATRLTGGEIRNLAILAILMLCFLVAEIWAHQSGILAVVVMGLTMSVADIPDLVPLKSFKGQLTVLLISVLFILLAGQLDLRAVLALGWGGAVVVAGLILVVRPLSVFLAVTPRQLGLRERLVVALTAPRGIVAAAVASLAARELARVGLAGSASLEGMVYLTIIVTGIWATVMALVLPKLLGYADDPNRRLTVLVGYNALSEGLARELGDRGRAVAMIDASSRKLEAARQAGISAVRGDARDASSFEAAGVQRDTQVVALTTNDELNLLVAELVRDEFGVEHPVVALQRPSEEFGRVRRAWIDQVTGKGFDVPGWIRRLESGRGRFVTVPLADGAVRRTVADLLADERRRTAAVVLWDGSLPVFRYGAGALDTHDSITLLVAGEALPDELVAALATVEAREEAAAGEPEPAPEPAPEEPTSTAGS